MSKTDVGVVVIGRNEGERLRRCLSSVSDGSSRIYVDSGSTDGSQELASTLGFDVVDLDTSLGFTAARARNAGLERLREVGPPEYVQFVDGDCEVRDGWIESALTDFRDDIAVVFGRRRERFPDCNLYHRACDIEWDVPAGEVESCGGDALFRVAALDQVGGYNPRLIAGEEPELCLRLRANGWKIISNAKEMTWHDVAINRFGQWWRRAQRTGYGFAALLDVHGTNANPSWRRLLRSAGAWSLVMIGGLVLLFAALVTRNVAFALGAFLALALLALGIVRTAIRARPRLNGFGEALRWSALLFISKLAQAQGWLSQQLARRRSGQAKIIEYK